MESIERKRLHSDMRERFDALRHDLLVCAEREMADADNLEPGHERRLSRQRVIMYRQAASLVRQITVNKLGAIESQEAVEQEAYSARDVRRLESLEDDMFGSGRDAV